MQVRHIVAAADESEEGRAAILAATELGRLACARVSVLTVAPPLPEEQNPARALAGLAAVVQHTFVRMSPAPRVQLAVARGLPGIEIGRYAETNRADLIVVGRKRRSPMQRLLIGDTGDAVARRSRMPCLFVGGAPQRFHRMLVALDGSERGMSVLIAAIDVARAAGARLRVVSVEPSYDNEAGVARLLTTRSAHLVEMVFNLRASVQLGSGGWDDIRAGRPGTPVVIHRGRVVDEVVLEAESSKADLLVIGYHRGGPVEAGETGSIARRLVHEAPCAVMTVPL